MKSESKKVLIVSPYFFPSRQTAARRLESFKKALDDQGIPSEIITQKFDSNKIVKKDNYFSSTTHKLRSLLNKIKSFFFIDTGISFYKEGMNQLHEIYDLENYSHVITSYGPWASHKLGWIIKRQNPDIKWIADFRDDPLYDSKKWILTKTLTQRWLKKVTENCDVLTTASVPITEHISGYTKRNIPSHTIFNGFDFELVRGAKKIKGGPLKIGFAGSFYGPIKPYSFFEALSILRRKGVEDFEFHMWGQFSHIKVPDLIRDLVVSHDPLPYSEIPTVLAECDILLLILPVDQGLGVLSSKIFDYFAIDRPILNLAKPGDTADIMIKEMGAGKTVHLNKSHEIANALLEMKQEITEQSLSQRNWEKIKSFSRRNQRNLFIQKALNSNQ